jgi:hypothetical protein
MRLQFGKQHKIKWYGAFADSAWNDDKSLDKHIKEATPEQQTLYFIQADTRVLYIHLRQAKARPVH